MDRDARSRLAAYLRMNLFAIPSGFLVAGLVRWAVLGRPFATALLVAWLLIPLITGLAVVVVLLLVMAARP